jgi:hypothetical protein
MLVVLDGWIGWLADLACMWTSGQVAPSGHLFRRWIFEVEEEEKARVMEDMQEVDDESIRAMYELNVVKECRKVK